MEMKINNKKKVKLFLKIVEIRKFLQCRLPKIIQELIDLS